jgi:hypothetical protein
MWWVTNERAVIYFVVSYIFCEHLLHRVRKIMAGFREALSPNTQTTSHWMLYLYIPPPKQFHERPLQDGAQPHFSRHVTEALTATFPGRWIGSGGPDPWPHRSPHLTPLGFFFWGHVKNYVYMDKIRDLNHLKLRIREAAEQVTKNRLQRVCQKVGYRLDICRVSDGAHMESY